MASPKPALVFVHGAWLLPSCWEPILPALQRAGYETACPRLPSSGGNPVVPDISADVESVRTTVIGLLDQDKDVVVVMQSYGGIPGSEALEGLDEPSRRADGKTSFVRRLIYITAFMVPEGTQLNPEGTRDNMVPHMITDFDRGVVLAEQKMTREILFQDVTEEQLEELNAALVPQSIGVYWSKTKFAAWRYIPTTYVRCMRDMPSTVAATQWLIDTARSSGQCELDNVIERDVGHCCYYTQPEWTAEMIRREAGEDIQVSG